ncbi:MAG TPA: AtpZ/AtpI family protein [Devosiaceae bacterium]
MVRAVLRGFLNRQDSWIGGERAQMPQDARGPDNDQDDRSRIGDLGERIRRARGTRLGKAAAETAKRNEWTGAGRAYRLATEFFAAIIVGAAIGYTIDVLVGSSPWALIVMLMIGFAAGVLNVLRAAAELNAAASQFEDTGPVPDDDEDDQ